MHALDWQVSFRVAWVGKPLGKADHGARVTEFGIEHRQRGKYRKIELAGVPFAEKHVRVFIEPID